MNDQGTYRQLAALAHAGHRLAAAASLDDALDLVAWIALDLVAGDSASIGRIDHARGLIRIQRNVGNLASWEQERPDDEVYPVADFPPMSQAGDRATAWASDIDDPNLGEGERQILCSVGKRAMLVVPFVVDGAIWGMVSLVRSHGRPAFDAEDLAAGEAFGGMVGSALARIEERSALEALAYRDALTGLGNRRAVDDRLEAVFAAGKTETAVAALLCDVNGLKQVNDDHGHAAGDRLLRDVARLLSHEAGSYPGALAARLGGDEFCLVIDGADEQDLQEVARRLTHHASELDLGGGLSCGYAVAMPSLHDAPTSKAAARALLRLADAAQYRVKRNGRSHAAPASAPGDKRGTEAGMAADIVRLGLQRLQGAGPESVERLAAIATAFHDVTGAGAWAVSCSLDGGPVEIMRNLDRPRGDRSDVVKYEPGVAFDLETYPMTCTALAGGSFHATLVDGDEAERGFLAASGYAEMIAAGRTVGRHAWLVEVCGDALSAPLASLEPLLRVFVELAVVEVFSPVQSAGSSA